MSKKISQKLTIFAFDDTYLYYTFTECVSNQYTHFDIIDMPDVTASYGTPLHFITFIGYFHTLLTTIHVWSIVSSTNIDRLSV